MPWAAVIGSPIAHSLSPRLHEAAWASLGLSDEWSYSRREVDEGSLPAFMSSLDADFGGLSVTMPCKRAIMGYLDVIDPVAEAVGSVNTVIPTAGPLAGANTDVHGIVEAIRGARTRAGLGAPSSALILGSGATAASALAAAGTLGALDVSVASRRIEATTVQRASGRLGVPVHHVPLVDAQSLTEAADADLVISALPAGVADPIADVLSPRADQTLLDVVYAPRDTALVRTWLAADASIAFGLDMLVHQGARQVALMTGREPDLDAMFDAVKGLP